MTTDQEFTIAMTQSARQIRSLEKKIAALQGAASALVTALDACAPAMRADAVMAYVHGARYDGPTFGNELAALRSLLEGSDA